VTRAPASVETLLEKIGFSYERHFLSKGNEHVLYGIRKGSKSDG
jgi:hypothetical protein